MKRILFYILVLTTSLLNAQVINFPDPAFKAILLQADTDNNIAGLVKIDANDDGEIDQSEALTVYDMSIPPGNIVDLTGIEYFTNIIYLGCIENNLQTVDLSSLTNLKILGLYTNQLTSINLNGLSNLRALRLEGNLLTEVDFSTLSALKILIITQNHLTHLDFSNNPLFEQLRCNENPYLSWINIRNNRSQIYTPTPYNGCWGNCPNLTTICVDDNEVTSTQNFLSGCGITQAINVTTDCSLSIDEYNLNTLKIVPNPSNGLFQLSFASKLPQEVVYAVYDVLGKKLSEKKVSFENNSIEINLTDYPAGVYQLRISVGETIINKKLVKN